MRDFQAPPAKITRPVISGFFPREKLFSSLDSMRENPAIWVSGPAGAGKTTLIASYLSSRKIPHLWYQMDKADADPASFFYYMGLAAGKPEGKNKKSRKQQKPLPLFTAEYTGGLSAFIANYFENLYDRLKPPYIIVFDNCHEVQESPPFEEITAKAILLIPPGIQCILISRYDPPARLVYLLSNRKMESIGWEDIKFGLGESEVFVNTHGKKTIPMDILQKLHEKTRGWAAGLVLLMREMKMEDAPESLASVRPEKIFDYFAGEILGKMDRMTVEFLLKASFLPRIPASLAEKITGLEAAGKILAGLSRSNYFIERRNVPPVYQIHPLFREFLNTKAAETYSREEISAAKRAGAALLEDAGQIEDAAELWMECEDWEALSALALKNAEALMNQGRARTLEGWISRLPAKKLLESPPWLFFWLGVCRMAFDPAQARSHLEKALQQFVSGGDLTGTLLSWSFIVDSYLYEWDDFSTLGAWIDRIYSLMGPGFRFPSIQIEAKVASSMMCAMVSCRPGHPDAEKWAEKALALSKDFGDPASQVQTTTFATYFYGWRGDFKKSVLLTEDIRVVAALPDISPLFKIGWLGLHAINNLFITPSPETALENLSIGSELAEKTGVHVWDQHWVVVGAFAALMNGDFKKADEFLDGQKRANIRGRIGLSHFFFVLAYREFMGGNLVQAAAHAEASLKYANETKYPYAEALCHFESAQIKHALGLLGEAEEHLRSVESLSTGSRMFDFMCALARAQFSFDKGEEAQGLAFLREGFRMGRQQNYFSFTWWWDPPVMAALCAKALQAEIEPHYARELVRKRGLTEYAAPVEVENWPWPVKVYTLGEFRVVMAGTKSLEPHGKPQQKPLLLLKLLIALGHKDTPEEKIIDYLWPDAEGDLAHKSCEITCLRLRRIIGDKAIRVSGGLVSLDEKHCWTDLKSIMQVMEQAESLWKSGVKTGVEAEAVSLSKKAMDLTQKAIGLHKGDFLPSDPLQPWAMAARERTKNRLLGLVTKAGKYLMRAGQFEAAVEMFEKGLELDNLVEELYQNLMLCQITLGRRGEAARAYEKCRKALSETLGLNPSPTTEKIYKSIF